MTEDPAARLGHASPGVRRIAILDLAKLRRFDELSTRLDAERDEKARLLIIQALGRGGHKASLDRLWKLYENASTPARVAHAAILAHDTILNTR